jgi:hypothetical protein
MASGEKDKNYSKYLEVLEKIEQLNIPCNHDPDKYERYNNLELIELRDTFAKKAVEYQYQEFLITILLRERKENLEKELLKARYDRENSDLAYNETTSTIN